MTAVTLAFAACGEPESTPPGTITEAAPTTELPAQSYSATPAPGEELPRSQTTPGPIPVAFRHVWAIEAGDCIADPALTRIAIAPGAIRFYEGRSEVVSANAPHEGALVLQVNHSSEGQMTSETHTLALDEAGTTLTYQRDDNSFIYKRCD
ncbi:MAG: hypothetical protein Q8R82_03735 [Hyphomonadaceae bacterium]|nr:hypothetical protein [Hyphomonadaceae bacterium]